VGRDPSQSMMHISRFTGEIAYSTVASSPVGPVSDSFSMSGTDCLAGGRPCPGASVAPQGISRRASHPWCRRPRHPPASAARHPGRRSRADATARRSLSAISASSCLPGPWPAATVHRHRDWARGRCRHHLATRGTDGSRECGIGAFRHSRRVNEHGAIPGGSNPSACGYLPGERCDLYRDGAGHWG
jgi:hypothetical protein